MGSLSQTMRKWRADYMLGQADAAEILQVSRSTYGRWERNPATMPYRDQQRFAALVHAMDHAARQALDGIVTWAEVG